MLKARIASYDEIVDLFTVSVFNESEGTETPMGSAFQITGAALPALIGEYGEPDELVGNVFTVNLP